MVLTDHTEILQLLEQVTADQRPVEMIQAAKSFGHWTILRVNDKTLVARAAEETLLPDGLTEGAFDHLGNRLYFRTELLKSTANNGFVYGEFTMPRRVTDSERRGSDRISVPADSQLRAQLQIFGEVYSCKVMDISHAGARLELPKIDIAGLVDSLRCRCVFGVPGITYDGQVQVRWFSSRIAGVFLPEMQNLDPETDQHPWLEIVKRISEDAAQIASMQVAG